MKSFKRIIAVILTAVLLLSTASCVPASLTKQWSYKYNDEVLTSQMDIGVYIYALYQAYNEALTYAEDNKDYVEGEPFTNLEITDEDGNTAVASEWIKTEAEKIAINVLATDYLVAKHGAEWEKEAMDSAKSTAQDTWDMGAYASYGYYSPMADELEPYGISFDSFFAATYQSQIKQDALFGKMYDKDGVEPVSDEELTKFFKESYVAYSYVPVNLYESKTGEDGNATNTAFKENKQTEIKDYLKGLADKVNDGSLKGAKAIEDATAKYKVAEDSVAKDKVELLETAEESNADIAKALKDIKANKATTITVGADGDTPTAYLIVRHEISDYVESYIKDDTNRPQVLSSCKQDDFTALIEKTTEELLKSDALTANTSQLNRYKADMFYVEPEEETTAEDDVAVEEDHEGHDHE